jgi:hypothetical protein
LRGVQFSRLRKTPTHRRKKKINRLFKE